jgi:hypothetical protein
MEKLVKASEVKAGDAVVGPDETALRVVGVVHSGEMVHLVLCGPRGYWEGLGAVSVTFKPDSVVRVVAPAEAEPGVPGEENNA